MDLFKHNSRIDFVGRRRIAYMFSAAIVVGSLLALFTRGLNLGLDFTGGVIVEVSYPQAVDVERVRSLIEPALGRTQVQHFGDAKDVLIRVAPREDLATVSQTVLQVLRAEPGASPTVRRVELVGAQVGRELVEGGGLALLITLGGILVYIWIRFEPKLALGAVAATLHDPLAILGLFAVTGMEFDLTVLAATLAVIGYSVNDTIVVFDRIRENFRRMRKASSSEIMNASINQTLSRTIMTSGTTALVVATLYVLGGPSLRGFSAALLAGIVIGTYSSIYVASASALDLGIDRRDLVPEPPKPDAPPSP